MRVLGFFVGSLHLTMPPAAARTIAEFLDDTGTSADDYDLIATGDLGAVGSKLLHQILSIDYCVDIKSKHNDCGMMIFDLDNQDVNSGGSGCGCGASVLCSHIIKQMKRGVYKDVLFVATGALMSPTSAKQGQDIPGIAHLVHLKSR